MPDAKGLIDAIRATKPMDLVNHPFTFAAGVGLANGLLAKVRGKSVDLPTAVALAAILGVGETVLVAFEKPEPGHEKPDLWKVGLYSVLGVAVGLAPFVSLADSSAERRRVLIASRAEQAPAAPAEGVPA